jgi:hypothetical protein
METKLTLKLNRRTIQKAKKYVLVNNTSISKLVENYFDSLTVNDSNNDDYISPVVKELSGVINLKRSPDRKTDYTKYLSKKYK